MIVFAATLVRMSENGQSETGPCVEPEKWWQKMTKLDKGQYVPKLSHCQCEAKTTNIFT